MFSSSILFIQNKTFKNNNTRQRENLWKVYPDDNNWTSAFCLLRSISCSDSSSFIHLNNQPATNYMKFRLVKIISYLLLGLSWVLPDLYLPSPRHCQPPSCASLFCPAACRPCPKHYDWIGLLHIILYYF